VVVALLEALMDPQVSMRTVHFIGAIIAVGAVTATDSMLIYLHFKGKFSETLSKVSLLMSMLIWVGLAVLATTGAFLIYTNPGIAQGTFFHVKMALVGVIFINGIILNEKIYPRFQDLANEWPEKTAEVTHFEKFAAIFGLISVLGWWTILLMVQLKPYLPF
jgi:hypothetical protein